MEAFETTLTGSDGQISGIVTPVKFPGSKQAFQFTSLDGSLHLTIALENNNTWIRIAGTTPYFPGWVEELAEKALQQSAAEKNNTAAQVQRTPPAIAKKTVQRVKPVKAESAVSIKTTTTEPKKAVAVTTKSKPTVKKNAINTGAAEKSDTAVAVSKKVK